ncbi:MAG: ribonuclease HII [Myxococcota bacterium]
MIDVRATRLDALRDAASRASDDDLAALCDALARDARAGARALARRLDRRLAARAAERARLERLLALREALRARGFRCVAGVDEVGVGPLAGPVVAAAVVLPARVDPARLAGLDDSKRLSAAVREQLDAAIRESGAAVGIGCVEPDEIDRLDIYRASLEAMRRAVVALREALPVDHLLVDARVVPGVRVAQTSIVKGDARDASIAAASIVAKVHRDALMRAFDERHPGYGFARHMGYGTAQHLAALRALGPSPIHRRSFAPVAAARRA